MKVTGVDVHVVSVPYTFPETWRFGRVWGLTNAIVEVHTDEGITGIGEVPGSPLITLVRDALEATIPWIVGEDPLRVNAVPAARRQTAAGTTTPISATAPTAAIEMALWDICGKAHGCPVHQFFGGLDTEHVPFYWFVGVDDRTPETAREQAAEGAARGFKTRLHQDRLRASRTISRLARAIRDEVGDDVAVRVDANEAWSVFEAVDALQRFEDVGVEFVEQPIDMHNIDGLADLRAKSRVRIGANQSAWLPHQVPEVIAKQRRRRDRDRPPSARRPGAVPQRCDDVRDRRPADLQARVRRPRDHDDRHLRTCSARCRRPSSATSSS